MPPTPKRKKIQELRMERRVGLYKSDPERKYLGLYKAPKAEQRVFRRKITSQIKNVRKTY